MDVVIEFNPAAFKHHIAETDIRNAFMNALYDDVLDDSPGKHLLLGFDRNGTILEVLYNIIDENSINVFHAMNCRGIYFPKLDDYWRTIWHE
ncbi:hypothetical protein AGMMS49942_03730 [Spirochaetia bacterium]|nr:hypothetical protein AGMMS49942_03730 [Spirochaetia bacterium]